MGWFRRNTDREQVCELAVKLGRANEQNNRNAATIRALNKAVQDYQRDLGEEQQHVAELAAKNVQLADQNRVLATSLSGVREELRQAQHQRARAEQDLARSARRGDTVSESTKPTIIEALTDVKADVGAVGKGDRNTQQGFMFRGIDAVLNAVAPMLIKHGVVVAPVKTAAEYGTVEVGQKRTPMGHCRVTVTYRFHGPAGDFIDVEVPGEAMDSGDKATAKAMSVAYRIALLQALSLPTDEPDPDSQTYERSSHPDVPEPVTDPAWLDEMEQAITAADSKQSLQAVGGRIAAAVEANKVAHVHREHLSVLYRQRQEELSGAAS